MTSLLRGLSYLVGALYVRAMGDVGNATRYDDAELAQLVACPVCDTLHRMSDVGLRERGRCVRCHTVLITPRDSAMTKIVMLSITATVLMMGAISFPFLTLEARGLSQRASVIDAILAFSNGLMLPLSLAIAATIVVLPLLRLAAILYALAPMAIGNAPAPGAIRAYRLAEVLKPWAMAEIFIVGTAVALVKVAGLAHLTLGPAFWAFTALVLVTVLNDNFMCRLTIWRTLEARRQTHP